MKGKLTKTLGPILGYGIIVFIILAILSVIALFSGAVMKFFGFTYKSVWHFILFFVIAAIISFPIGLFTEALPKALLSLNKLTVTQAKILFMVLDTMATAISMAVVDYFMDSVSATTISIFVVSLILAALTIDDFDEDPSMDS